MGKEKIITVVGTGKMGRGIAQAFATSGYQVRILSRFEDHLSEALDKINHNLGTAGKKNIDLVLERIETTTNKQDAYRDVDIVIEAVSEDIEIKHSVMETADKYAPEKSILATNTSTIPITEIANTTDRPENVVGMHFSNPAAFTNIVEVICGEKTSDRTFEEAVKLGNALGKTPLKVKKDVPGFLGNRIIIPYALDAIRQVEDNGYATKTIDAALRRIDLPMGPFELMDFVGLDVLLKAAENMQNRGISIHIPETLVELVEEGHIGVKSGNGFYSYSEAGEFEPITVPEKRQYDFDPISLIAPAVNGATWLLEADVATQKDIDQFVQEGLNWPRGLFQIADEYGIPRVVDKLRSVYKETGFEEYEPNKLLVGMLEEGSLGWASGNGFYEWEYETKRFNSIQYERREFLGVITFNRPDKLNSFNRDSWEGFRNALDRAAGDTDVRATLLRGEGNAFSAGDDIAEINNWESEEDAFKFFKEIVYPTLDTLRNHPKPTISVVDGFATAGGCEIILLSDMAVGSVQSKIGLSESLIGVLPPWGLSYGLLNASKKDIMELTMTGKQIQGEKAAKMGLLNYAVPDEQVEDVARELARETTAAAPSALEILKKNWVKMEEEKYKSVLDNYIDDVKGNLFSDEGQEGIEAFLAGNQPNWVR